MIAQPFDDNDNDVAAPGEWLEPVRSECGPHSTPVAAGTALRSPLHGAGRSNEGLGDLGNSLLPVRRYAPSLYGSSTIFSFTQYCGFLPLRTARRDVQPHPNYPGRGFD